MLQCKECGSPFQELVVDLEADTPERTCFDCGSDVIEEA